MIRLLLQLLEKAYKNIWDSCSLLVGMRQINTENLKSMANNEAENLEPSTSFNKL